MHYTHCIVSFIEIIKTKETVCCPILRGTKKARPKMARKKRLNDLYLRFLNLKQAVEGMTGKGLLDEIEERLLHLVADAHLNGHDLNVTDLMQRRELASPATLHKRLGSLKAAGLISIEPVPGEYPRKSVQLTDKAIKYFNELSKGLRKVARDGG